MADPKALREERSKILTELRAMKDNAEKAGRKGLNGEEETRWNKGMEDAEKLRVSIEREETLREEERKIALTVELKEPEPQPGNDPKPAPGKPDYRNHPRGSDQYRAAFHRMLTGGMRSLTEAELRAVQTDVDVSAGYLVMPMQFSAELIKAVDNLLWIRQIAHKETVLKAVSLGATSLDADPDDFDWTGEITAVTEDTGLAAGNRDLTPHQLSKQIKVSRDLIRQSDRPVEALVQERLAYKLAVTQEKAFLTGNGAQRPLGVFTASAQGISTSRDKSTGNTTTSITFDGLIENKYNLKSNYWSTARWLFHRDAMKQISKLKNGDGEYQFRPSVLAGEPDTLLGHPVMVSEYAPNTFTTGLYIGLFGDFSRYWIADALDQEIQRLEELYAATNQIGFIVRSKTDGMPVLEEAFSRITLA